ncbi:TerD family protein [Nonomuraea turkmeniaca]|uniref:TerD family protein n=1 Tax=Nonomuraea turkmeniaca TaxID=103838 RepID=A0A5S4FA77_9ACTN|nr:TerD family protein [Nonomuraea turkmeniaca]TMR14107.1 TerD family protein [Nonomuraea turkmeniaca]
MANLESLVIARRLRVPIGDAPAGSHPGQGEVAARQLDAALLSVGFKCSAALLERLADLRVETAIDLGVRVLAAVRELVGDHVQHNAYFLNFPRNVPDTVEFWVGLLSKALLDPVAAARVAQPGPLNLLALPEYGRYQHSYADLLAAHAELIPLAGDRITVLELGGSLEAEARELYFSLAGSEVPLSAEDLAALRSLTLFCDVEPERIPVRENRAVINEQRLVTGRPLLVDTVTDVLRVACGVSGGDVTLATPTRFRAFRRAERRTLIQALDAVASPAKLGDVKRHPEQWKRLGERLHPHEYPGFPRAAQVFEVARGDRKARSFDSRVEAALASGRTDDAVDLLGNAPGALLRRLDHLLRISASPDAVLGATEKAAADASGRVLLSLREHLQNRLAPAAGRVFANRNGRAWVTSDTRTPIDEDVVSRAMAILDEEIARRLPDLGKLIIDPEVLDVALPLSGKAVAPGLGMLPRGSLSSVDGELLRFFVYWRQAERRTDYDLSALMLDASYDNLEHVSWTNYGNGFAEYSGDLTDATDGASEFINIRLAEATKPIIIPQVNIYSGEAFDEAAEAFFGFMIREAAQDGMPFEPRTVRMKSDLRGSGRVALPLAFLLDKEGDWQVKWLHLYLKGSPHFNQVEGNRISTSLLVRSIVERDYLRVHYLVDLLERRGAVGEHTTYIGLQAPADLPEGTKVYTPSTLHELIPA